MEHIRASYGVYLSVLKGSSDDWFGRQRSQVPRNGFWQWKLVERTSITTMEKGNIDAKLINLAFRVSTLADVETLTQTTTGWKTTAIHSLGDSSFVEASFGDVRINFFKAAIYDKADTTAPDAFLHASFLVNNLSEILTQKEWADALVWGPETIHGSFGRRRIAFFDLLSGCRFELMEQLSE